MAATKLLISELYKESKPLEPNPAESSYLKKFQNYSNPSSMTGDSYYNYFYTSFLATANSLPLNSLWFLSFDSVPDTTLIDYLASREYGWGGNMDVTYSTAYVESNKHPENKMLIVQGVKENGETLNVIRSGVKQTGYLQGLISEGRDGHGLLNISFVETNLSFVDYVLRPWLLAVGYESLKQPLLKTNITVTHLGRMGHNVKMASRKKVIYKNCVPVSIAEEESNYSGGNTDALKIRQVQFAYDWVEYQPADNAVLDLISTHQNISTILKSSQTELYNDLIGQEIPVTPKEDVRGAIVSPVWGDGQASSMIGDLLDRAKEFATQLVTGTVDSIVTNAAGAVGDAISNAVGSLESSAWSSATSLVNTIDNGVKGLINGVTGVNGDYNNDTPSHILPLSQSVQINNEPPIATDKRITPQGGVSINVKTPPTFNGNVSNTNDNVTSTTTLIDYVSKTTKKDDVRNGELNTEGKTINQDDVRHGEIDNSGNKINQDDARVGSLDMSGKSINQNDVRTGIQLSNEGKTINQDDMRTGVQASNAGKTIGTDDMRKGHQLSYDELPIKQDDYIKKGTISYIVRSTSTNDSR